MSICLNAGTNKCLGFCYSNGMKGVLKSVANSTTDKVFVVFCDCCGNGYGIGGSSEDLNLNNLGPHTWIYEPNGAPVCCYNGHTSQGLVIIPKPN